METVSLNETVLTVYSREITVSVLKNKANAAFFSKPALPFRLIFILFHTQPTTLV
jgi:hypothetical protein